MHLVIVVFKRRKWESSKQTKNVLCLKITNVEFWDLEVVKLYNYISFSVFFLYPCLESVLKGHTI